MRLPFLRLPFLRPSLLIGASLSWGACTDLLAVPSRDFVVTVLYFDNHTGDEQLDVLGKGLADMMLTDLAQVEGLTVVEREKFQDLVSELDRQQTEYFDPKTAGEIGKVVGATHSVTGAINAWEPDIRLDVRVIEVDTATVTVTDQVTGPKKEFFALQQDLSGKLIAGLGPELEPPDDPTRIDDGDLVLDYARGLDQLDRGEFGTAYQMLEDLVKRAPRFGLAAKRRDQVGGKIREARERRDALLGEAHQQLLANADAALEGDIRGLGERGAGRWFGYRQVRGDLFLDAASGLVQSATLGLGKTVPRGDRISFVAMLREYVDNVVAYNADARAYRSKRAKLPLTSSLPEEDEQRASQLGAAFDRITPPPDEVVMLAVKYVCRGRLPNAFQGVNPTPVTIDPGLGDTLLAEIDRTIGDIERFQPRHHERQSLRLLDHKADCLIGLGRREEAVATWQRALDEFPTSPEYDRVEQKLLRHHRR